MAICPDCGEDNPERVELCLSCGAALGAVARAAAERKVVTVLFCDLVGFTATAERLDPEDVQEFLTAYQTAARHEIERFGGSVERFIGDGVLAVFGIPKAHEDDAERAVRAALLLIEKLSDLDLAPGLELAARIGVNTGEVLVNLGVDPRRGDVVTGDVVNTAARLEQSASANAVLVGEATYRATHKVIEYESLEPIRVKGKSELVGVWRPVRAMSPIEVDSDFEYTTALIGRDYELELLKRMFGRALNESTVQLVTITGEPGVGKSRLVAEVGRFVDDLDESAFWHQGRSLPYGDGITFWALGEIVKAHAGILQSDTPAEAKDKLAAAVAAVIDDASERDWFAARLAPLVGAPHSETGQQVERMESFTAWRRFLEAVATQRPLVIVFEDLHWADAALLEFIEHLIDWSANAALFVLCTARPELYDTHSGWGGGKRNSTTISLSPLSDDETARLIAGLLGQAVLPAETHALLIERAGGNPLYAEEFVQMLFDRGILVHTARAATVADTSDIPVPDSLHALIAARLDTLPSERKALLADAAVCGKVFWSGAVSAISGLDERSVASDLHELSKKELVRRAKTSSMSEQAEYSFWHALIRDVAYNQIPRAARAAKHDAMAKWIESIAGDRVSDHAELLANHYEQVLALSEVSRRDRDSRQELLEKTCRVLIMAGDRAQHLDTAKAVAYYRRVLDLLPLEHPYRAYALVGMGGAAGNAGQLSEAEGWYEEAARMFNEQGEIAREAEAVLRRITVAWFSGEAARARTLLEYAFELLKALPPGPELALAYAQKAAQLFLSSARPRDALEAANTALTLAEQFDLEDEAVRALDYRGGIRLDLGDIGGIDDLKEALRRGLKFGLGHSTAVAYVNLGFVKSLTEGSAAALAIHEEGLQFCNRRGIEDMAGLLRAGNLDFLLELGRWDELIALAEELLEWSGAHGARQVEAFALRNKAAVLVHRGFVQNALVLGETLLPRARAIGDPQIMGPALNVSALIRCASGDTGRAVSLIEELSEKSRDWPPSERSFALPSAVRVATSAGRVDLGERLMEGMDARTARERNSLVSARAAIAEAKGELDGAAELYLEAATQWARYGFVLEQALALLGNGRCLVRLAKPHGIVSLREARELFVKLGASPLESEADSWLERATARSS